jgi:hypothetical protein
MKNLTKVCGIAILMALGPAQVQAQAGTLNPIESSGPARELLADLAALTLKCAVRPYSIDASGKKIYYPLESRCPELRPTSPRTALVYLERKTFYAELLESRDSDGGDLDDLFILDAYGHRVAMRHNVAAFDDILLALAGGHEQIPEIRK